ncbi:hypothetical protein Acor_11340 [Acrocarpospora corrugata]|uniref:Uncharacterized protein n=1 Tax=Acrocarpospora corrugata TaxID=35763 RepID=A0A5M3VWD8_9ACTN|nr:hypothetical protein [Acrocarpospora corrugata]GER99070.1 hypothetical protein Acor_11340 [Acrocarpospora corrugata]
MSESALYPGRPGGELSAGWWHTLSRTLHRVRESGYPGAPAPDPADPARLLGRMTGTSAEAADVPAAELGTLLAEFAPQIASLAADFGVEAAPLLVAFGRGWLPGGPDVEETIAAPALPRFNGVVATGSVTVRRAGRQTLLIAATDVLGASGPVRIDPEPWAVDDAWLCTVAPSHDRLLVAEHLLAAILPQAGVASHLVSARPEEIEVTLESVAGEADPDLVLGRLEGWRSAIERLCHVQITWR